MKEIYGVEIDKTAADLIEVKKRQYVDGLISDQTYRSHVSFLLTEYMAAIPTIDINTIKITMP